MSNAHKNVRIGTVDKNVRIGPGEISLVSTFNASPLAVVVPNYISHSFHLVNFHLRKLITNTPKNLQNLETKRKRTLKQTSFLNARCSNKLVADSTYKVFVGFETMIHIPSAGETSCRGEAEERVSSSNPCRSRCKSC
jgi:hypothetical protein